MDTDTPMPSSPSTPPTCPPATDPTPTLSTPTPATDPTPSSSTPPPTTDPTPSPSTSPQPSPPILSRSGSFAQLAKHLVMQERMKASGELPLAPPTDATPVNKDLAVNEEEEDGEEEEQPLEQLEERATAGDANAQTSLGRYYLNLPDEGDAEANNHKAVTWLIKAAKQGSKRASKLLRHCLTYKKGITKENEAEMKKLASETKFERAVRKAAMMMYWKLNPDRKNKVAVTEMLKNVQQVNSGAAASGGTSCAAEDQKRVLESMVSSKTGKYVDLEDFVEITKKFTQGIAPTAPVDNSGDPAEEEEEAMRKNSLDEEDEQGSQAESAYHRILTSGWGVGGATLLNADSRTAMSRALNFKSRLMILQYPLQVLLDLKEHLVEWASRAGLQWISTIIPTHHVNALIFFFIISNLTIDLFAFIIPLLIFYLSFTSMVICTLRVFQNSKSWENFRALTTLLSRFEPGLDLEQAETNFGWNNLEPYLYFLLSVFFVIFSFPVADKAWIPCSELAMVAIFFTVASYISLSSTAGLYMRRALIIEVASSACALTARLPERMAIARLLGQTFATVPLGDWVELRISAPCLLYMYLFYLFFRMAQLRGFHGTYCFLVPYLVCFTWCEFSGVLLQSATPVGLLRTCVACFLIVFALPVLMVGLAAMLLVQMVRWFLELQLTRLLVTLAVCAVPVILRLWTRFSLSPLGVLRALVRSSAVKLILFWVSAVLLFCCVYVLRAEGQKARDSSLTWQQYRDACGPPAWRGTSLAQTQLFCSHLEGHRVTWTGHFKGVAVAETENGPQAVINLLPKFVGDWLRCLYGEAYPDCENVADSNGTSPKNTNSHSTGPLNTGLNGMDPNNPDPNITDPNASTQNATAQLLQHERQELCRLKALTMHDCHVKRFDNHRFEVTVGMISEEQGLESSSDMVLRASTEFRQVLLRMEVGREVQFSAVLEGKLGSRSPLLQLQAISTRALFADTKYKMAPDWKGTVLHAIKFAFDFFFSPFLSARIHVKA